MADLLRNWGFSVFGDGDARHGIDDEVKLSRGKDVPPFYLDICGCDSKRILVIEIDGYRGHRSRHQIFKDKNRTDFIKEKIPKAEVYRFAFWQLKDMPDSIIAEELGLK